MKTRRQVLGAAVTLPVLAQTHSHAPEPAGAYSPKVFSAAELDLIRDIAETIIPRTDTPGAADARVHPARVALSPAASGSGVFNSSDYMIQPALKRGRVKVIDNAVVARVLMRDDGRASGVQYFDRYTKAERQVKARTVVAAAGTIDSTRILLNSKSSRHPNGIGNSNDAIGRYLCEQIRFHMYGFLPPLLGSGYRFVTAVLNDAPKPSISWRRSTPTGRCCPTGTIA